MLEVTDSKDLTMGVGQNAGTLANIPKRRKGSLDFDPQLNGLHDVGIVVKGFCTVRTRRGGGTYPSNSTSAEESCSTHPINAGTEVIRSLSKSKCTNSSIWRPGNSFSSDNN